MGLIQSSKFKVQSSRFKVQGSKFKVQGSKRAVRIHNPGSLREGFPFNP
jgi:hypothetical protein